MDAGVRRKRKIVIFCFDPFFRETFDTFVRDELGLGQDDFIRVSVYGGPAAIAHRNNQRCCGDYAHIMRQIRASFALFNISEIILIGHGNCGYYKAELPSTGNPEPEESDLPIAANHLAKEFPATISYHFVPQAT